MYRSSASSSLNSPSAVRDETEVRRIYYSLLTLHLIPHFTGFSGTDDKRNSRSFSLSKSRGGRLLQREKAVKKLFTVSEKADPLHWSFSLLSWMLMFGRGVQALTHLLRRRSILSRAQVAPSLSQNTTLAALSATSQPPFTTPLQVFVRLDWNWYNWLQVLLYMSRNGFSD